ncbi:alpha-1,6-mannosylglycoprotein 6-beta-N-acetylglucosaminyltransferase B-like isoform X3 [Astatotilapia calliptera]|uniref:alpha-1,6-mannosylglycoprotein 6-beta-N-acetylglucosaminyltransferase B-like isoform X3 n=1 Tax=Astatotilapia calliptera TaxID=8154 RepID=UPI000E416D90|nr:alpha-1,6-mannosylglycoprotein 6-beta-N-acetylglucosaminyltransferase B-like isoform X3 [Astatotilapia calliptera]
MRVTLRPRSGCLVLCLCLSVVTLLLQSLWVPLEMTRDDPAGSSPEDLGQRGLSFRNLALRLEALNTQVQRLSREKDGSKLIRNDLTLLLQSFRQDQQGLARLVERELKRVSQRLDQLSRHPQHHHQAEAPTPLVSRRSHTGSNEKCQVPVDPAYPVCAEKVEFLQAQWQSDPCYAFYGVDGTTCSVLTYLSQTEDFCPPRDGRNHSSLPWHQKPQAHTKKAEIRKSLLPLYEAISNNSSPAMKFIRSRVEKMSERWIQAGLRMKESSNNTVSTQMRVLLYPGALSGSVGQRFEAMVERGGPLGELVQWADLSACLTILGHNLIFSTSQHQLHSLIGAAPGRGSCPIQRPLTFDLIYTDYHGLAHLQGAMGLAFKHYQCRFRILDSFGTEPAFNFASYARSHGYKTLWGSWDLQPLQYMTMFPHTPDNSFLGFVSEGTVRKGSELEPVSYKKDRIAVVYGKQDYMWQGKYEYVKVISEELETHATVYQPPGHTLHLPSLIRNHGLLTQEHFQQLLRKAKLFVGLGFPYEGPAPIEAIGMGCVFIQPRFDPPHSSASNDFYKGKPTTRQISSQHPYAEEFIGKPYVWTVDVTNKSDIREAVKAILRSEVKSFTPQEFTCVGMLKRVLGYITHQNFCSKSVPTWPPKSALRVHLAPLGQSCVSVCRRSSLMCEPALFHHLNTPAAFTRLGLSCASVLPELNHLFPSYSPWGRQCGLQQEPLLFSCAGSDPSYRRLCPCKSHLTG